MTESKALQDLELAKFLANLTLFELFNYSKDIDDSNLCRNLLFNFYCCNISCNAKLDKDDFVFELNTYLDILSNKDIDILLKAKDMYLAKQKQYDEEKALNALMASFGCQTISEIIKQ